MINISLLSQLQVFEFVEELPSYTEPLDNNRSEDIESTGQKGVWKLLANKVVFMAGKLYDSITYLRTDN